MALAFKCVAYLEPFRAELLLIQVVFYLQELWTGELNDCSANFYRAICLGHGISERGTAVAEQSRV